MKMKKMIATGLAVLLVIAFAGLALAQAVTLTGTVEMSDDGPVLNADGQTYILDGSDLDDMVGKNVTVTGSVEGEGDAKTLLVESIEEN